MSRTHNAVVQPGRWTPRDFLSLKGRKTEIIFSPTFFLLRRNGFFIQLPVATLNYIPWVFVRVNDDQHRSSFLIINNFSQTCYDSAIRTKMFSWFFERSLWSSRENEVSCQKGYLEISCEDVSYLEISWEYVREVHLFLALIYH